MTRDISPPGKKPNGVGLNKHTKTGISEQVPKPKDGAAAKPKSSELTPGPGFRIKKKITRCPAHLVKACSQYEAADVSDMLNRMFTMSADIKNQSNELPLCGSALTVKLFPGDNLMLHKALDVAEQGDVVVVDTSDSRRNAVLGDLIANKAKHRGIAGFIIDGLIRDLEGVIETGLPVYAKGVTAFGPLHRGPGELNYPVSCGGVVVNPGDIVTADRSGITVVRRDFAKTIALRLELEKQRMEAYVANVKRGIFSNSWVDDQLRADGCIIE